MSKCFFFIIKDKLHVNRQGRHQQQLQQCSCNTLHKQEVCPTIWTSVIWLVIRHGLHGLKISVIFIHFQVQQRKLRKMLLVRQYSDFKITKKRSYYFCWLFLVFKLPCLHQSTLLPQWERSRSAYANRLNENGQVWVNHWNFTILSYAKKTEVSSRVKETVPLSIVYTPSITFCIPL